MMLACHMPRYAAVTEERRSDARHATVVIRATVCRAPRMSALMQRRAAS